MNLLLWFYGLMRRFLIIVFTLISLPAAHAVGSNRQIEHQSPDSPDLVQGIAFGSEASENPDHPRIDETSNQEHALGSLPGVSLPVHAFLSGCRFEPSQPVRWLLNHQRFVTPSPITYSTLPIDDLCAATARKSDP